MNRQIRRLSVVFGVMGFLLMLNLSLQQVLLALFPLAQLRQALRQPLLRCWLRPSLQHGFAMGPHYPAGGQGVELGHGLRPAFPDNLPRLERRDGRWHLNGLFRHGYLLAPALARQAAARLLEAA